jgi:hypothetical protein
MRPLCLAIAVVLVYGCSATSSTSPSATASLSPKDQTLADLASLNPAGSMSIQVVELNRINNRRFDSWRQIVDLVHDAYKYEDSFWSGQFREVGLEYTHVDYTVLAPGEHVRSNCPPEWFNVLHKVTAGDVEEHASYHPAFYCPLGGDLGGEAGSVKRPMIYVSAPWLFRKASAISPKGGGFAVVTVIAHETGHHVQRMLGVIKEDLLPCCGLSGLNIELMADCFAGIWVHHANAKGLVGDRDIDEAITLLSASGADRPEPPTETGNHGTHGDRVRAFKVGLGSFDALACTTATEVLEPTGV